MRLSWQVGLSVVLAFGLGICRGQDVTSEIWRLESKGEAQQARERLKKAAAASPADPSALRAYAEFLDRHRDPEAREVYSRLQQVLPVPEKMSVLRRLAVLDLLAGDRDSAAKHVGAYRQAGGSGLALSTAPSQSPVQTSFVEIPGPLRSFARMAALSPDLRPDDLLGALARNIITNGYQTAGSNDLLDQTEYLKLVIRYLSQARELDRLAGDKKVLRLETCESSQTGDILRILGYRMRGACGSEVVLETVNASRAFLTIDSGFPIADLEQALRTNRPFVLDYHPARIPILYDAAYWQSAKEKTSGEFIDYFIADPSLCRLYLGLSKIDPETAQALRDAIPAPRLRIYSHVLDFFGGMFEIRGGKAVVPGGARTEKMWGELAGAPPSNGAAFIEKLVARDDGWLASYFDALARVNGPVKDYLCEPERLKRFYLAIRGRVTSPGPARPVFRSNTDMMLLTTRLRMDRDGKPHIPGSLDVWKNLFSGHSQMKYDAKLAKAAGGWKDSDDVLEALFGLSRKSVENEPLKIFMALSDVERNRATPLEASTIDRLAHEFRNLGSQYQLFAEAPSVTDRTVLAYLDAAHSLDKIGDQALRADAAGTFQALSALWQIFVRQGSLSAVQADRTLAQIVEPFQKVQSEREVFDGGRTGVKALLEAAGWPKGVSAQDRMIDLLGGTSSTDASEARTQIAEDMIRVFEAQRLISLTTLFDLADNLESVSRGEKLNTALAAKLAMRISDIQLPRNAFSTAEKSTLAYGYFTEKHIDQQRKVNLRQAIEKAASDPNKLKDLRASLAPFLRDTLVGYAYIHYAPPGAQVLHTNPLFVRSHDFIGIQSAGQSQTWKQTELFGTGWPANAGGRLVGSLAALPYALAEAEQNFLIPTREQALIWGDLVPQLILSAVVPRWWNTTPLQIHWVGVNMAYAETLLAESALNADRRAQVLGVLERYAPPARVRKLDRLLAEGDIKAAGENVLPSEMYLLATEMAPQDRDSPTAVNIMRLAAQAPDAVSPNAISRAFGTPKPTLANSYRPELLNLRTFPTLMGYSSRILAESWESNILYYAGLADEVYAQPGQLNVLIPAWTQQTVEQIFATHLEDWPALLRSLRIVGDDVRQKARKQMADSAADNE
ncbi:MAG TPA: hypothetical protein VMT15_10710 [Bryobacteraceae bacterium]|nr:hypothetical protein [Bryobacteraceae bacterium]